MQGLVDDPAASITDEPASGAYLLRAGLAVARPAPYGATRPLRRIPAIVSF
jgi:hypothetical protein